MWSICKFTFTWKPWIICCYYSKAISSLFSPATETEPLVNTINFAASRYFYVKAMKDLLLSKRFQVYFRRLQKPSRKWIQSISPPHVNVANKLAKVACTTCIPLSLKCGPFVRLFSRGIGQATSSLLSRFFRVSMLDSKDSKPNSIIDARSSRGSRIEDRVSILDSKETVNLHLHGTVGNHFAYNKGKCVHKPQAAHTART